MAARAQNGRVEAEYFLTAVAGNPGKRWVYIDNVVEVIGDDNRLVAAIKDAGSDAQAAFAVFPVGDVGLDYHKAGFNAFLSIDGCAVGVYPVRFAVGGVVQDVFFKRLAPEQVAMYPADGLQIRIRASQNLIRQFPAHRIQRVASVLLKRLIDPLDAATGVQNQCHVAGGGGHQRQSFRVDIRGRLRGIRGVGHRSGVPVIGGFRLPPLHVRTVCEYSNDWLPATSVFAVCLLSVYCKGRLPGMLPHPGLEGIRPWFQEVDDRQFEVRFLPFQDS